MSEPEPNTPFLRIKAVGKSYWMGRNRVPVLRDVAFEADKGAFLAMQGSSGAGKSTLLHLVGGLDRADSGEIWFEDTRLDALSNKRLSLFRNRRIGFIFQAYNLLPELDALENVCLPARMARTDGAVVMERGKSLLKRVGLDHRMDHRPYELSGGEQQRVAIARALINSPELILADEPTGNLDHRTGEDILKLLMEIRQETGATLIMATHDSEVAARAPRTLQLTDGIIESSNRLI